MIRLPVQKISITQEELDFGEGQFDQYMQYVLQRLTASSCVPELAVFQAIELVKKDGYSIRLGSDTDLSGVSVANWITNIFGERQNISYCLPYIAYQIYGVTYSLRMPILRPDSMLLTQAVVNLSPDLEGRLSVRQFAQIEKDYNEFYDALEKIARFDPTTVIHLESAAERIYAGQAHYALSHWESLHFVERAMKEILEPLGIKETGKNGHDIAGVLHNHWQNLGKKPLPQPLLDAVKCSADLRYQRSPTSFVRAIHAHHDSIRLAALIAEEVPPALPMEDRMTISLKDLTRGASLLIARTLPAFTRDQSPDRRVKIVSSHDSTN